jgi:hypothetical protein
MPSAVYNIACCYLPSIRRRLATFMTVLTISSSSVFPPTTGILRI